MTARVFEIPLRPRASAFGITLAGTQYRLTFRWCAPAACWMLSIADADGVAMVSNVPLVTGLDVLAPHRWLGFGGALVVQTDNAPDDVPSYDNLGVTGRLYFIVGWTPQARHRLDVDFILDQSLLG